MKFKSVKVEFDFDDWMEFYHALRDGKNVIYTYYYEDTGEYIETKIFLDVDGKTIFYYKYNKKDDIYNKVVLGNMYESHDDRSFYRLYSFTLIEGK